MRPLTLEERACGISPAEYLRAYTLLSGEAQASETVDRIFNDLRANPEHTVSLDPQFVALLALFSETGVMLAATFAADGSLHAMQRELAGKHASIRAAFPHLLVG